ncbi:MAG: hypothetical protein AB1716_08150, partial [Planctomycetota bacterium]
MHSKVEWRVVGILAVLVFTATAGATDWYWTGGCGTNGWYEICNGTECSPGHLWRWNNWGEQECHPTEPAFPGVGDDVHIGGLARVWYGWAPGVYNVFLGAGAELSMQDGGSLTVNGPTIQNDGELWLRWGGYGGNGVLNIAGETT